MQIPSQNNFDALRLILSATVVLVHSFFLSGREELRVFTYVLSSTLAVQAFFAVSGFLVVMSFENSRSVKDYFEKRARRILPAYTTVVLFWALAGVFLTIVSMSEYFSLDWLRYVGANLIFLNFLHPSLPGVFTGNPAGGVNGALWTIKIEVLFYVMVPILVLVLRKYKLAAFVILYCASALYNQLLRGLDTGLADSFARQLPGQLSFFVSGSMLYYLFGGFRRRAHMYGLVGAAGFVASRMTGIYFILPMSVAVLVVYFACCFPYLGNAGRHGDFSYGVYIWHYPILQTLTFLGMFEFLPWLAFVAGLLATFGCASISWRLVEKPFLKRTSHYRVVESGG